VLWCLEQGASLVWWGRREGSLRREEGRLGGVEKLWEGEQRWWEEE